MTKKQIEPLKLLQQHELIQQELDEIKQGNYGDPDFFDDVENVRRNKESRIVAKINEIVKVLNTLERNTTDGK